MILFIYNLIIAVLVFLVLKMSKKLKAVKLLHSGIFTGYFNANDFFAYACAHGVQIVAEDFDWIIDHIKKYKYDGLNAALAYIQNQEPIKPWVTDNFKKAIDVLIKRKQKVEGDIDWDFYNYNENGPYRQIEK